ncbi:hypothetical protein RRG08_053146 [Elysia crispata]|uniref:Uncharacterized protein n=1 Tax=Elysia crispata TaxID=231223 RepID=A0AAE1A8D4_9GAST|nr:hypothetical protein RRG08_053146 [Elysia crispata]
MDKRHTDMIYVESPLNLSTFKQTHRGINVTEMMHVESPLNSSTIKQRHRGINVTEMILRPAAHQSAVHRGRSYRFREQEQLTLRFGQNNLIRAQRGFHQLDNLHGHLRRN